MITVPLLVSALAGLAALPRPGHAADKAITKDSYFYGQSPPVFPSPDMTGDYHWADAFNKAKATVGKMTLAEKVNLTAGVTQDNGCSGNIPAIDRLDFPGLCLSDAGNGLRATDFVSSFPSGIHVGASWNKNLTYMRGAAMAGEFKRKGVNVLLGPVVGPAWRVVRGGRNWEGFSVDPYLSGSLASESITGIQDHGVITSTKHFIANEQETNRNPLNGVAAVSSNIDDKTMHEMYLWPFQDAVKAGTGNIMCSYQRVNNSYGCANSKMMNGLLKEELGFQGWVVTDWTALRSGVDSALAGVDMAMPDAGEFWGKNLVEAVKNGSLPESRVTDMATRIMASWYQVKQDKDFPEPGHGMPASVTDPHKIVEGRDLDDRSVLLKGAIEGHVLVKNTKNTLPLKSPRMLSLFGYSAKSPDSFAPSPGLIYSNSWKLAAEPIDFFEIVEGTLEGASANYSTIGLNGTMLSGGGSGGTTPAVFLSPFEALKCKAFKDGTALFHDFLSAEPIVDPASDACIVFGNAWAAEGYDRPAIWDNYTDTMIKTVADQCDKTIVVLHNAGTRLVEGFVDHANVTAILFAHLPGQDTGEALVSLLYGESNPSGKLPYTVAKNDSDYGSVLDPDMPEGKFENFPQSDFKEGVYLDYRRFDKEDITPRYEFGFGLSYTTFKFTEIVIEHVQGVSTDEFPTGKVISGGQADLWDHIASIKMDVTNTGDVAGAEVAQLYMGIPTAPEKQLRGFEKTFLKPGESATVSFELTRRDLSVWNTDAQKWQLQSGKYKIYMGNSSRNLPLRGCINL